MAKEEITILCTGDIHLGRHPTRIPENLDGPQFSPRTIWLVTVQAAIREQVDAVVVTGDVVDRENRYFEAYGAFQDGARSLDEAGIPLIVVAGNHDFDVLPRIVADLDPEGLHLLGSKDDWERWTLERDGEALLHFDGWSFPTEHVLFSPLESYDLEAASDVPVVGVLHADLDAAGSDYAPVATSEFTDVPVDAWLLGHIHKPEVHRDDDPFVFYPGSPQPLSPAEPGQHGPWLLKVSASGSVAPKQLALATLRYDRLEVDAQGAEDSKAVPPLISDSIEAHLSDDVDASALELFLARVRLKGQADGHAEIERARGALVDQLAFKVGTLPVLVETLEVATRPVADLKDLARGQSPVAYLAQLLLDLDERDPKGSHDALVEEAANAMRTAYGSSAYNFLRREDWTPPPEREDALPVLRRQARLLLDTLLDQKAAGA